MLTVKGCIVSVDAMGCQREVAAKTLERGADYLLALKANQPELLAGVERQFAAEQVEGAFLVEDWAASGNRTVAYKVEVAHRLDWVECAEKWPGLVSLVRVESRRQGAEQPETRYYISSVKELTAEKAYRLTRSHWSIENQLHWQLDVTFGEDRQRQSLGHAPANLSLLRKIALHLAKQQHPKLSKKKILKKSGWSNDFLLSLLKTQIKS